ncbi:uncharacterized protein LOC113295245 [Papaver somniferum]|uniref:uncharacterized protein LOC113295245 n=1 Tax=Papaver somniferum TaxID=3469 RepID=UPI000E7009DD|nr:uncharacterized protein LOC113295245 [Papaver somniferum]
MAAVIIPTYEEESEQVNVVFPNHRPGYNPYSSTYNPGWKDHPNFSYANKQDVAPNPYVRPGFPATTSMFQQSQQKVDQHMQKTDSAIKDLQAQMGQMETEVNQLKARASTKLPSQTFVNPRENFNEVFLRSGKQTEDPKQQEKSKKKVLDKEIMDIFSKVHINIPFIEAIRTIPRYAKVLKDLCTRKERLIANEITQVGESASSMLLKKIPTKCKDPGGFTVPINIGDRRFERALLDLGASISVMSSDVYDSLNLGPLKDTWIIIQLANKSNIYPKGLVEDVLVQVNELIFPDDFFIVDMHNGDNCSSTSLLLGRPFIKTAKRKIDCDTGTLTMEFDKEIILFNIFEAMRYPSDIQYAFYIDVIGSLAQQMFDLNNDELESFLQNNIDLDVHGIPNLDIDICKEVSEACGALTASQEVITCNISYISLPVTDEVPLPYIVQAPKLELKPIPDHLKYSYLGDREELPIIIAKNLTAVQEERLLRVIMQSELF